MTRKSKRIFMLCILRMMLIVAMAFSMTGCNGGAGDTMEEPLVGTETDTEACVGENSQDGADVSEDVVIVGEGETVFQFMVVDAEGVSKVYEIHTDKTIVGDALLELGLIAGDEAEYGLYVKTVDGITVDYEIDGKYWAFYVNGEYAMTGVDATPITEGEEYAFKVE